MMMSLSTPVALAGCAKPCNGAQLSQPTVKKDEEEDERPIRVYALCESS